MLLTSTRLIVTSFVTLVIAAVVYLFSYVVFEWIQQNDSEVPVQVIRKVTWSESHHGFMVELGDKEKVPVLVNASDWDSVKEGDYFYFNRQINAKRLKENDWLPTLTPDREYPFWFVPIRYFTTLSLDICIFFLALSAVSGCVGVALRLMLYDATYEHDSQRMDV